MTEENKKETQAPETQKEEISLSEEELKQVTGGTGGTAPLAIPTTPTIVRKHLAGVKYEDV